MKNILVFMALISCVGCTDATRAKIGGYGDKFKVQLVNCDGSITHEWVSTGKVSSEQNSDGYYFNDQDTGSLIEVTGVLIITKL
jgi:hypothetical protein